MLKLGSNQEVLISMETRYHDDWQNFKVQQHGELMSIRVKAAFIYNLYTKGQLYRAILRGDIPWSIFKLLQTFRMIQHYFIHHGLY